MPSALASTNKCGIDHDDLSLYKQLPVYSGVGSPCLYGHDTTPGKEVLMLKIVHPICCGIDVHKNFVVATIAATNKQNITDYKTKRFSTFTHDLNAWLNG